MKAQSTGNKYKKGMATLEILIAFAVLILCISAVIMVSFGNQSVAVDSRISNEAIVRAQKMLEKARADSREDFNLVNPYSTPAPAPYSPDKLNVDTSATDPSLGPQTKRVASIVSWQLGGRTLSTILTTLLTNPGSDDTCSSVLAGDWKNPKMIPPDGYDFKDLISESANGFSLTGLDVDNGKLYVTTDKVPGSYHNDYTFFIFNVSNPLIQPPYLSTNGVDNNPSSGDGLNAVTVAKNGTNIYAYVANSHDANFQTCAQGTSCSQLQVIDVSDPTTPKVQTPFGASYKLPSASQPYVTGNITSSNGQAVGKSIFYKDGYIYLGLTKTTNGPAFHVIDVHNPLSPQWVGSWPASSSTFGSSGAPINSIYVKDGYAYLAHPTGLTGAPSEQLTVVDVSVPTNPQRKSGFFWNSGSGGNGKSVFKVGDNLYLGRTATKLSGVNDTNPEFFILNATNPTNIPATPLGSLPLPAVADSINGLTVRDFLVFFLTNQQFQIWNISNPGSIFPWTQHNLVSEFLSLPSGRGTGLDCESNYFYFVSDSSQGNHKDLLSVIAPGP